jgi:streptogramin lyase
VVTQFSAGITGGAQPDGITLGPDGNLWFTERGVNQIGRITLLGVITRIQRRDPLPTPGLLALRQARTVQARLN